MYFNQIFHIFISIPNLSKAQPWGKAPYLLTGLVMGYRVILLSPPQFPKRIVFKQNSIYPTLTNRYLGFTNLICMVVGTENRPGSFVCHSTNVL